jgi:hypothetical protein
MPYLILGIVLLGCLLLGARLLVNADAAKVAPALGWFATGIGVTGAAAVIVLLVASDRLAPALALAGGLTPVVLRARARWRRRYGSPSGGGAGSRRSEVETALLRMRLDHATGLMSGQVRRGPFAGRRLEDLQHAELMALWRQCVAEDEPSARLLETYLDRLRPDWRQATNDHTTAPGETMTREQAYAILDLAPGADPDQIKEAHRRLMMKLHPDHGGSTFLAAQINRAKDILLGN